MLNEAFEAFQFNYCSIIWILHGGGLNNPINRIHELTLRLAYLENSSSFAELLEKDNFVMIY